MIETKRTQLMLTDAILDTHFAEAYRALRANISLSSIDAPVRSILVTSASPGEGKTTTVANLGIVMARAGHRVVVVDADLRRPDLHHVLGSSANGNEVAPGLSNAIVGQFGLEDVMLPTGFAHLSLIAAGIPPPNPSELLGSQRMQTLIADLTQHADLVVLDSPACLLYADALLLSRLIDGVLYVVRAGAQNKAAQRRVQKQLQQAKARMLGVVFNGVPVKDSSTI